MGIGTERVSAVPHCPLVSETTSGPAPTTVQSMRSEQLIPCPVYPTSIPNGAGGPKVVAGAPVAPATPAMGMIATVPTKRMAAPTPSK
jgi:hypothetical protein